MRNIWEPYDHTPLHLSDLLLYQWCSRYDFHIVHTGSPPLLVDEMPSSLVSKSVLPGNPANLVPTSIAPGENGNVLMGLSMICVELNRYFGIVDEPERSLYESGTYPFSASVASTQGGTIFSNPLSAGLSGSM